MKNHITDPAEAHTDLLSATRHLVYKGNLAVKFHHVKGHQDSKCFGPFTRDASLNIEADLLAKSKLEKYQPGPSNFRIPWSQGVCYLGNKRVEKAFAQEIRDYINGQRTKDYWVKRRSMTQGIWKKIDWESVGRAMNKIPINRRRWVAKYVAGHFATGKNMCRWKFRTSSLCPRCNANNEDKQHILTCPAPAARSLWEKHLKTIDLWLRDEGTDPQLREHLMSYLKSWPLAPATSSASPPFAEEQNNIGHQYMMDGWLSQEW